MKIDLEEIFMVCVLRTLNYWIDQKVCYRNIAWKNLNELVGQPSRTRNKSIDKFMAQSILREPWLLTAKSLVICGFGIIVLSPWQTSFQRNQSYGPPSTKVLGS